MSAMGNVIAAKIMALNQEEKAAVLSFCVGYGCDDPLTKSADAALMCLKGGILLPAEHAEKCTCCADYRESPASEPLDKVRRLIKEMDDVKSVLELKRGADGRIFYMIETPFTTYPKFVIGWTDDAVNEARPFFKCGVRQSAVREWEKLKEGVMK